VTFDPATIKGWHAHVYYGDDSREQAIWLREAMDERFDVKLGRWREEPVGPHPMSMYQVAFAAQDFADIVPWLAGNRNGLNILVHPCTSNGDLWDHSKGAMWLGRSLPLRLEFFEQGGTAA
jgi:DOPA 4,5-dioxygenase